MEIQATTEKTAFKETISTKRLLMQYLRLIPYKLGLVNKAAFLSAIRRVNKDDIFLVSYPKSGNTWVRFILAYIINGTKQPISFAGLEDLVPDVYHSKDIIDSKPRDRIIKTHDMYARHYPRIIYVYRDYREALVSFYHYRKALGKFNGSFSDFIRSDSINSPHGSWKQHIKAALETAENEPGKILLVSYESLMSDFTATARKLAAFCRLNTDIDYSELETVTSFDQLKDIEAKHSSRFMGFTQKHFMRSGKINSWMDTFTPADLQYLYIDSELTALMKKLGYECIIPATYGT